MEKRKGLNFVFLIVAIILGVTLFKQFDFKNLKFEKPALAIVYLVCFVFSIFILLRDLKKK